MHVVIPLALAGCFLKDPKRFGLSSKHTHDSYSTLTIIALLPLAAKCGSKYLSWGCQHVSDDALASALNFSTVRVHYLASRPDVSKEFGALDMQSGSVLEE